MKRTLIAAALLSAVAASPAALAGTVDYGNYSVTYDDSFWAGATVSSSGNTLSFADLGYYADVTGVRKGWKTDGYYDWSSPALTITADQGYKITGLSSTASGAISSAGQESYAYAQTFLWASNEAYGYTNAYSWNGSSNGNYAATADLSLGSGVARLGLTYQTYGEVQAKGLGVTASVTHDSSSFSFNVSPVPEPETYTMLLAGMGLMGSIARRRREQV